MAYEHPGLTISLEAGASLASDQFKLVALASDGQVDVANKDPGTNGANKALGVLQNKPAAQGSEASVMISGITKAIAGETIVKGNWVGQSNAGTNGRFDVIATNDDVIMGIAITGGDAGEVISVLLFGGPTMYQEG